VSNRTTTAKGTRRVAQVAAFLATMRIIPDSSDTARQQKDRLPNGVLPELSRKVRKAVRIQPEIQGVE